MKKRFFVFVLIFSLLIIDVREYWCNAQSDSFLTIERNVLKEYEFIENGLKLEYSLDEDLQTEKDRLYNLLNNKSLKVSIEKNCITAIGNNINYSVKLYDDDDLIKVEVVIVNKDKSLLTSDLKDLAEEIRNNNFNNERYFSFVKGKLNNKKQDILQLVKNEVQLETLDSISISNGKVFKGIMKNGTAINIGQINYDTGSYLIIGTPMIFITY